MDEINDVQALEHISNEVCESQIKITLSSQCIKAQVFLVNKLRKQSDQRKEACNYINNGNLKLETEIKIAEQKMKSSIIALETIKSANIELKKEVLLNREKKMDIFERIKNGIVKYNSMWKSSKTRYDNIPFIKNYLQTKNECLTLRGNINILVEDYQRLSIEINKKHDILAETDKNRIIKMAVYLIHQRPKVQQALDEKIHKLNELKKDIQGILKINVDNPTTSKIENTCTNTFKTHSVENSWTNLNKNDELVLPKLQLRDFDLDILTDKLDQIKRDNLYVPIATNLTNSTLIPDEDNNKIIKLNVIDINIRNKNNSEAKNYSKKKLVNILDDLKLDKAQTYDFVSKIKPANLQDINIHHTLKIVPKENVDDKVDDIIEHNTEDIAICTKESPLLMPPTQFSDLHQDLKSTNSQQKNNAEENKENNCNDEDNKTDVMIDQMDVCATSEENFDALKDNILKKNNLDLSPQFTYSKKQQNTAEIIQTLDEGATSKFFEQTDSLVKNVTEHVQKWNQKTESSDKSNKNLQNICNEVTDITKNPKNRDDIKETYLVSNKVMPVSDLLFQHGTEGIAESLDLSMSTTGYEDGDNDFPHCIDSSLLLSPKADLPESNENNVKVTSQEVPNFLSGIKKSGLSFLGRISNTSDNVSESKTKTSDFNFNFGGEEKKSRSGLFSMFH